MAVTSFASAMKRFIALFTAAALAAPALAQSTIAEQIIRTQIDGIDSIAFPTGVKDVVTFTGSFHAGDRFAPEGQAILPTLVGEMIDKGTVHRDKFAIAQALDNVGAQLSFGVGGSTLTFNGKCLTADLPLVIGILAEQLREPAFDPEELAKAKTQLRGLFRQQMDDTDARADQALAAALYPPDHPNYQHPYREFIASLDAITVDDLKAFHATYYGPASFTLVAVGDIDVPAFEAAVGESFAGWTGGVVAPAALPATSLDADPKQVVRLEDKANVSVRWGQTTGLRYDHPDSLALRVATAVLGRGFTGRLMANVRDKEGLTYGIWSNVYADSMTDGHWMIGANFAPDLLEQGIASTQRQLDLWVDEGVTDQEVANVKSDLIGYYKVGLATTNGMAGAILTAVQRGYDLTWLDQYPEAVAALTTEQVNDVIKRRVDPAKMVLIEAGTVAPAGE